MFPFRRFRISKIIRFCLGIVLGWAIAIGPGGAKQASHILPIPPTERSGAALLLAESHPIEALIDQGRQAYAAQRFPEAVRVWGLASEQLRSQPDSLRQALTLSYLTAAYQQLNQWDAAQNSIDQSLDRLPPEPLSPQAQQVTAQVHNTLGSLQFALGQTQAALETWQQAAALYTQVGDTSRYLNNLLNQVQAQQTLGYYQQARHTLSILEQQLPQQDLALQIRGHQRLGQAYRLIGDLTTSETHLKIALSLVPSPTNQPPGMETGPILLELANTLQAQGDAPNALDLYQQAIEQSSHANTRIKAKLNQIKVLTHSDPAAARIQVSTLATDLAQMQQGRSQVYAYINASQSLLQLGSPTDRETAARLLALAIQQSMALQDHRAEAYAKGYLGHVYEISQQWSEAQTLTEEALTLAQALNATDITYQWHWQLGRLLKQQYQPTLALQAYRAAFNNLQSLKQDLVAVNQDLQFSFRDSVEPVYRELIDLLLQPSEMAQASQYSVNKSNQPPAHPTRQAQSAQLAPNQAHLREAREVLESLQVAELDNFFRTACLDAQRVSLEAVEQTTAAIIYPIILPDRLEMVVNLPGQPLQQFTTSTPQAELEQTLTSWRQNLEKPFTTPEGKALGQTLYDWMIKPMQPALDKAGVTTLTFVLDGALRNVPMAALYDGENYLIEQYAVALSPGLQLLGPRSLQETSSTALVAGLSQSRHGFSALLNVKEELTIVSERVNSHLLLDEEFTTDNLNQQISGSERPILHLATHGQFSSNAEETFILAWDRPIPVNELSALLTAGDLNRAVPIELLILSACETATGDSRAALGLAGVALQSGTRSTLASLWNLDDTSGAFFIDQFYQALSQPQTTKAEALQQAQIKLLKDPNYRHPTYWSAYVLIGSWL